MTEIYILSEHPVREFTLRALLDWEKDNTVFSYIKAYCLDLCNIWPFFPCWNMNDVLSGKYHILSNVMVILI